MHDAALDEFGGDGMGIKSCSIRGCDSSIVRRVDACTMKGGVIEKMNGRRGPIVDDLKSMFGTPGDF